MATVAERGEVLRFRLAVGIHVGMITAQAIAHHFSGRAHVREKDSLQPAGSLKSEGARFNVTAETLSGGTGKVKFFEGTPIPSSIVLVFVLAAAAWSGAIGDSLWGGAMTIGGFKLHPLVLLFALSGSLMISRIRIPKL